MAWLRRSLMTDLRAWFWPSLRWVVPMATISVAQADVRLASLFQDHLVLQRDARIPVWGRAEPGERVAVSFAGNNESTTADSHGRWRVDLEPRAASAEPRELTVSGRTIVVIRDVLVGEVWLCSGQSNMAFPVRQALNAEDEKARAHFPRIRQFHVALTASRVPSETVAGEWAVCSPESVGEFTAVGYFFAREIHRALGVPVGLINSSWGGTFIESWMSEAALRSDPAFAAALERKAGLRADGPVHRHVPSSLFNGMIAPLAPYALRGVLWYQGEANGDHPEEYRALFAALIGQWRRDWGRGDFPFYFAQLSSFKAWNSATGDGWGYLREAQAGVVTLPHTGMAVTHDIGEPDDVHPRNKQEVGRRLALLALNRTYARPVGPDSGPILSSSVREGGTMILRFSCADGLRAEGGEPRGFEIAAADQRFVPARAEIRGGGTVAVWAPGVSEPAAVRYAWRNVANGNLRNAAGLPAGTFRTDDWKRGTP